MQKQNQQVPADSCPVGGRIQLESDSVYLRVEQILDMVDLCREKEVLHARALPLGAGLRRISHCSFEIPKPGRLIMSNVPFHVESRGRRLKDKVEVHSETGSQASGQVWWCVHTS